MPTQPRAKQAGADHGLRGGLLPHPLPEYLKEEAQHEGQGPEAEARAYLVGVHALVWKQAPRLLHLLQLRGRGPEGESQAPAAGTCTPGTLGGGGEEGLGRGPGTLGSIAAGPTGDPAWVGGLGLPSAP